MSAISSGSRSRRARQNSSITPTVRSPLVSGKTSAPRRPDVLAASARAEALPAGRVAQPDGIAGLPHLSREADARREGQLARGGIEARRPAPPPRASRPRTGSRPRGRAPTGNRPASRAARRSPPARRAPPRRACAPRRSRERPRTAPRAARRRALPDPRSPAIATARAPPIATTATPVMCSAEPKSFPVRPSGIARTSARAATSAVRPGGRLVAATQRSDHEQLDEQCAGVERQVQGGGREQRPERDQQRAALSLRPPLL